MDIRKTKKKLRSLEHMWTTTVYICYNCKEQEGHLSTDSSQKEDNKNKGSAFNSMSEDSFVGAVVHKEMEKNIRDSDQAFNSMSDDFTWIEIKPDNEELQKAENWCITYHDK